MPSTIFPWHNNNEKNQIDSQNVSFKKQLTWISSQTNPEKQMMQWQIAGSNTKECQLHRAGYFSNQLEETVDLTSN